MGNIYYILKELIGIVNEMSPYLMLGLLFAGILYVFLPKYKINKYLGKNDLKSVVNAAILGVPMPLCSCGVIPTGISVYKNGASKGSSVSFLISTPQTGVDSILVTYSMLGLPFAIIRPIIAFITGILGGVFTNIIERSKNINLEKADENNFEVEKNNENSIIRALKYAYIDFLGDIAKWLVIGVIIAAVITVLIPDNFFLTHVKNDYLGMLIILAAAVPLYVCATASVPIAAALIMKGLSPGAALVFLMAGPATNAATILLIGKTFGRKTLFVYLFTIISGALLAGIFINTFLPSDWFVISKYMQHHHSFLPYWLQYITTITLTILIAFSFWKRNFYKNKHNNQNYYNMGIQKFKIEGMTCNHCKMSVESNVKNIKGIEFAEVDLVNKSLLVKGENVSVDSIKNVVEKLGYKFVGMS